VIWCLLNVCAHAHTLHNCTHMHAISQHTCKPSFTCAHAPSHSLTNTHTHKRTSGSPLIVPWDDAAAGYALLGLQTSQPVAGPAAFLRASELLPWILSVPRLGKNPPTVMSLEMKDIDIPGLYIHYLHACMHNCIHACILTYICMQIPFLFMHL